MNWSVTIGVTIAFMVLVFWWVYRRDKGKIPRIYWLPALLRSLSFGLLMLLLLAPVFTVKTTKEVKPKLALMVDKSSSMLNGFVDTASFYTQVQAAQQALNATYDVSLMYFGSKIYQDTTTETWAQETNITAAIEEVIARHKQTKFQSALLISDGIATIGADAASIAAQSPFPIHTIATGDSTQPIDASVQNVLVNKVVSLNAQFEMIIDIAAYQLQGKTLSISISNSGNTLYTHTATIQHNRQLVSIPIKLLAKNKGMQKYSIQIEHLEREPNVLNNRYDAFVEVIEDKINVLLYAKAPHPDIAAIQSAIATTPQFQVTVTKKLGASELANAQLVVIHQPSASDVKLMAEVNKPAWYILSQTTSREVLASLGMSVGRSPILAADVLPLWNPQFYVFSLPEKTPEVIPVLPPLEGMLFEQNNETEVLLFQKVGNVATQQPLWYFKQIGGQKIAITKGTGLWRWKIHEFKGFKNNEILQGIIKQTLMHIHSKDVVKPFAISLDKQVYSSYEKVQLYGTYKNSLGELSNLPKATYEIQPANAGTKPKELGRIATSYKEDLGFFEEGSYSINATLNDEGKQYTATANFEVSSFEIEALRQHSDFALMQGIASQSGGSFSTLSHWDSPIASLISAPEAKVVLKETRQEKRLIDYQWLYALLLGLLATEWFLRRNYGL